MMEHLPASPDDAIAASMELVDKADVYIGVFAYRFFSFLLPTVPALAAVPGLHGTGTELRELGQRGRPQPAG